MDIILNNNQSQQYVTHHQYLEKYQQPMKEAYALAIKSSVNRKLKDRHGKYRGASLGPLHSGDKMSVRSL